MEREGRDDTDCQHTVTSSPLEEGEQAAILHPPSAVCYRPGFGTATAMAASVSAGREAASGHEPGGGQQHGAGRLGHGRGARGAAAVAP